MVTAVGYYKRQPCLLRADAFDRICRNVLLRSPGGWVHWIACLFRFDAAFIFGKYHLDIVF